MNKIIEQINIDKIYQNKGATLHKDGKQANFKKGYQVSIKDLHIIKARQKNKIKNIILKELKRIKNGEFLGVWLDNKKCYIDKSKHFDDLNKAINTGKANNQISIYDFKNNNCIYLKNNK